MNDLEGLYPAIQANLDAFRKPGVLAVRPGYKSTPDGKLTTQKAVVAVVDPGKPAPILPSEVDGFPVDVRQADSAELLEASNPMLSAAIATTHEEFSDEAFPDAPSLSAKPAEVTAPLALLAAKPQLPYEPADVPLAKVSGRIPILCHASPDAGWPTLKDFLSKTSQRLTVGMYDFTSKHILDAVEADLAGPKSLVITLDHPAPNPSRDQLDSETLEDLHESLGNSLKAAWALNRMNSEVAKWIYPSAYHIKVAVRDGKTVWVSSGNWNNSNQPDFQPSEPPTEEDQEVARKSDRDWHVVIDHEGLAKTFEAYLQHDYTVAQGQVAQGNAPAPFAALAEIAIPFAMPAASGNFTFRRPLLINDEDIDITPLLTPDPGVYVNAMIDLVNSAEESLYIQLQYVHPSDAVQDAKFGDLFDAVMKKVADGKDVRVIVSEWQRSKGWLDRLQAAGFDLRVVRIQTGVHNKGFVVDGKTVALGSQNWSGDGVLRNRDASVIIRSEKAAQYYAAIFQDDWANIARPASA